MPGPDNPSQVHQPGLTPSCPADQVIPVYQPPNNYRQSPFLGAPARPRTLLAMFSGAFRVRVRPLLVVGTPPTCMQRAKPVDMPGAKPPEHPLLTVPPIPRHPHPPTPPPASAPLTFHPAVLEPKLFHGPSAALGTFGLGWQLGRGAQHLGLGLRQHVRNPRLRGAHGLFHVLHLHPGCGHGVGGGKARRAGACACACARLEVRVVRHGGPHMQVGLLRPEA